MNNSIVSKKLLGGFLAVGLLVIVVAIVGAVAGRRQTKEKALEQPNLVQAETIRRVVDNRDLPGPFPNNFPQESGAVILQNDVQTSNGGKLQATRIYITARTLAENYKLYQTYLQTNGWKVTATTDRTDYKSISAVKDSFSLQINLNDNQLTKKKTVDLYLIQKIATK